MPDVSRNLVLPIIHPNGTSKDELLKLRGVVYHRLQDVTKALCAMGPNGRDYYPEPGRMDKAVEQHRRRMKILGDLIDEIGEEINAVDRLGE